MKHSEITNPNDLHFSRLKLFAGDGSVVAPDFVDQILASTSNNKLYRATGTGLGQMLEISGGAGEPSGGTSGGSVTIGALPPTVSAAGSLHYEPDHGMLYIASSNGRWIGSVFNLNLVVNITDNTSSEQASNFGFSGVGEFSLIDYQPNQWGVGLARYLLKGGLGDFYSKELSGEYQDPPKIYSVSFTKNLISGEYWNEGCVTLIPNGLRLEFYPNRPITLGLNIVINERDL